MRLAALLAGLLLPGLAHALPWYVPDDATGTALAAAIAAVWTDAPVEIVAGPPDDGDGLYVRDDTLTWRVGGAERTAPVADLETAVVLARSWLRADPHRLAPPTPAPTPTADAPPPVETSIPTWTAAVGFGVRDGLTTAGAVEGVRAGVRVARAGLGIETTAFFTAGGLARVGPLDRTLAVLVEDGAVRTLPIDTLAAAVTVDLTPPPPTIPDAGADTRPGPSTVHRPPSTRFWVAPRALAGLEVRRAVPREVLAADPPQILLTSTPTWGGGPRLGAGAAGGLGRWSVRLAMVLRPQVLGGAYRADVVGTADLWLGL